MARLREIGLHGQTSATLTDSGTTLNAACLANLPALTAGDDYYVATLDPNGQNLTPEIVYVTAHTASATSATMVRGKENTSGGAHGSGTQLVFGPTALDFKGRNISQYLDFPKHTADTIDDDFEGDTLDGKWTRVGSGGQGTVDFDATAGSQTTYQVADGSLWVQYWGNNRFAIRQDTALAADTSVCVKFSVPTPVPDASGMDNSALNMELVCNDDNTGPLNGNYVRLVGFVSGDGQRMYFDADTGALAAQDAGPYQHGREVWFRMIRDGDLHMGAWSQDGSTWCTLDEGRTETALDNIWISVNATGVSTTHHAPIVKIDYFRLGGVALDPW